MDETDDVGLQSPTTLNFYVGLYIKTDFSILSSTGVKMVNFESRLSQPPNFLSRKERKERKEMDQPGSRQSLPQNRVAVECL